LIDYDFCIHTFPIDTAIADLALKNVRNGMKKSRCCLSVQLEFDGLPHRTRWLPIISDILGKPAEAAAFLATFGVLQ